MAVQGFAGRFVTGRGQGGLVHVRFDTSRLIQLSNRAVGEAARMDIAAKQAHQQLATRLKRRIAKVLEDEVAAHGREQRSKPRADRLANAIRSDENSRANERGYTVGYLDEIAAVAPYYRGLEVGTAVHVGRFLSGLFRNREGVPSFPGDNRTDATFIQTKPFSRERPFNPGVRIKHEIVGYQYFDKGVKLHIRKGGTTNEARDFYIQAFRDNGMQLMLRTLTPGQLFKSEVPRLSGGSGFGQDEPVLGTE